MPARSRCPFELHANINPELSEDYFSHQLDQVLLWRIFYFSMKHNFKIKYSQLMNKGNNTAK